jgi:hypothetical protein
MAGNLVVAAVLADTAFDAVSDAVRFSTPAYREIIEQMGRTGELPQTWKPVPITDIRVASPRHERKRGSGSRSHNLATLAV